MECLDFRGYDRANCIRPFGLHLLHVRVVVFNGRVLGFLDCCGIIPTNKKESAWLLVEPIAEVKQTHHLACRYYRVMICEVPQILRCSNGDELKVSLPMYTTQHPAVVDRLRPQIYLFDVSLGAGIPQKLLVFVTNARL